MCLLICNEYVTNQHVKFQDPNLWLMTYVTCQERVMIESQRKIALEIKQEAHSIQYIYIILHHNAPKSSSHVKRIKS